MCFFKRKTAYELRIRDWSSDVCSSDLGVAAEFGVIMLLYLRQAWERRLAQGEPETIATLDAAIREGAVLRVRPKAMTVAVILAALFPLFIGSGDRKSVA